MTERDFLRILREASGILRMRQEAERVEPVVLGGLRCELCSRIDSSFDAVGQPIVIPQGS